ncbi:hypothetical protein SKAU_G00318780 [Synaphobranchus kaupii]|uniref:C2 domain-containing protein n=1 Tax=Synaphobranchus kaupii TaxID=118154 RepID=A0A9Q1ETC7_SYNKA|nr:hypothetical protein SKAU_G00318780 [Synaphobranchus kaupii]
MEAVLQIGGALRPYLNGERLVLCSQRLSLRVRESSAVTWTLSVYCHKILSPKTGFAKALHTSSKGRLLVIRFKITDIMFGDKMTCGKSKRTSLCPNIITPETIPEFCIPSRVPALQATPHSLPRGEAPTGEPVSTHIIQVESVDDGFSDEESTNADPQSQAALSLPHLAKTQTCYGFCTLLESPNTRRKESIFHSDPASCSAPLLIPRSRSNTYSRYSSPSTPPSPCSPPFGLHAFSPRLSPRGLSLSLQGALDSDTTSSAESSPFSSPLLTRSPPRSSLFKALSHEKLLSRGAARKLALSRNNSLSTDEGSSTDSSPNVLRRGSEGLLEPPPCGYRLAPARHLPHGPGALPGPRPEGKPGARGAGWDPAALCRGINCSVSVAMAPGKTQKQRSTVIRKSRNPIFNEDFFFDNILEEDLCFRMLHFKVVNKTSAMKRDYALGDCEVPLTSILPM